MIDIIEFVRKVLQEEPDQCQKDALIAFVENKKTAIMGCIGCGKTTILAWCVWYYMCTHEDANVICTSGVGAFRHELEEKIRSYLEVSPLIQKFFEGGKTMIRAEMNYNKWIQFRPASLYKDKLKETFADLNSHAPLLVIDSSGYIDKDILIPVDSVIGCVDTGKIIQAGVPSMPDSALFSAFHDEENGWAKIKITGDPNDPNRSQRVSMDWANQQIETYGIDRPWIQSRVLGEFPSGVALD